jgi:molybdate transport system substrate-binding protein
VRRLLALPLLALLALPACGGQDRTLTVLAASSLTEAFEAIARDFEATHDVAVRVSAAGSQQLATQVIEGAPADVLASADEVQMQRVVDAGLTADEPVVFAHNALALVYRSDARVLGLANLNDSGMRVVLAAEEVPVGRYARQALDAADLEVEPVSLEPSVRAVLAKVELGEADAGIVYASDVDAAGDSVSTARIPPALNIEADYPIAVLRDAPEPGLADQFVAHVRSPRGQARLWQLGFRVDEPPE